MTQETISEYIWVLVTDEVHQPKLVVNDQKNCIVLVETLVLESYSTLLVNSFTCYYIGKIAKNDNYLMTWNQQPRQR